MTDHREQRARTLLAAAQDYVDAMKLSGPTGAPTPEFAAAMRGEAHLAETATEKGLHSADGNVWQDVTDDGSGDRWVFDAAALGRLQDPDRPRRMVLMGTGTAHVYVMDTSSAWARANNAPFWRADKGSDRMQSTHAIADWPLRVLSDEELPDTDN